MNNERLFNLVLMNLSTRKLTIEDAIERTVVSDDSVDMKALRLGNLIKELVEVDNSIEKFNAMITNNNNNEKEKTKN
jgi:hypothetical protein